MNSIAERRAVIDVGANSAKLLVTEIEGNRLRPLHSASEATRLGMGLARSCRLHPVAIGRTATVVKEFLRQAAQFNPTSVRVVATSAARDAANGEELVKAINRESGLAAEIISGEKEAELVFRGITSDPALCAGPIAVFDTGGGSTELSIGENPFLFFKGSFRVGTLRLLELLCPQDPPTRGDLIKCRNWLRSFIDREMAPTVDPALQAFCGRSIRLIGSGGNILALARLLRADDSDRGTQVTSISVQLDAVRDAVNCLWSLSLERRLQLQGLCGKRANTILTGAAFCESFMERFGFSEFTATPLGLRHGAVLEPRGQDVARVLACA